MIEANDFDLYAIARDERRRTQRARQLIAVAVGVVEERCHPAEVLAIDGEPLRKEPRPCFRLS